MSAFRKGEEEGEPTLEERNMEAEVAESLDLVSEEYTMLELIHQIVARIEALEAKVLTYHPGE